jgi:hypothetical protein
MPVDAARLRRLDLKIAYKKIVPIYSIFLYFKYNILLILFYNTSHLNSTIFLIKDVLLMLCNSDAEVKAST